MNYAHVEFTILQLMSHSAVRPNPTLTYTIGMDFCLEETFIFFMEMPFIFLSCELEDTSVFEPEFSTSIARLLIDGTERLLDIVHIQSFAMDGKVGLNSNATSHLLFENDTRAIEVTCVVSNACGNDTATTTITPCGNDV